MGAASYIGRIGGLAVAFGVGTAIITGQGVANATPSTGGEGPQTESVSGENENQTTDAVQDSTGGPGKVDVKLPRLSDIIGRHRADATAPTSATATPTVKPLPDAAEEAAKRVSDALGNAAGAVEVDGDDAAARTASRSSGSSSLSDRLAARAERLAAGAPSPEDPLKDGVSQTNIVVANQFVNKSPAVKDWLASPRVAAGRAVDIAAPVSTQTSLWTPPRILTAPLAAMKAAPTTPPTTPPPAGRPPNLLTAVLDGVFNPFAGSAPTAPQTDSPLSWLLAGASRRQIGVEASTSQSLLAPADALTYDPDITLVQGVIVGDIDETTGLTYTLVSQPSTGGKVLSTRPPATSASCLTSRQFRKTTPLRCSAWWLPRRRRSRRRSRVFP